MHPALALVLACGPRHPIAVSGPDACGPEALAAVRRSGLRDVTECGESVWGSARDPLRLVQVAHGPDQDCESGCFQERAAWILYGGRTHAVEPAQVGLLSPYEYVKRYMHEALPKQGVPVRVSSRHNPYGFVDSQGGWCANDHDALTLRTDGTAFWWSLRVPRTRCTARLPMGGEPDQGYDVIVEGELRIPIQGSGPPRPTHEGMRVQVEW